MSHASHLQLSALIDNELSLTEREAVIRHLEGCPACAARHAGVVEVAATLRTLSPPLLAFDVALLAPRRRRDAPLLAAASVFAATGIALVVAVTPLVAFVAAISRMLSPLVALITPGSAGATPIAGLAVLLAIGSWLVAYPLARWR